jgi:hypothetical protein
MPRTRSSSAPTPRLMHANTLRGRLDDYAEALALAEAGEQILASDLMQHNRLGRRRILVIGHGCVFSQRLGEYALSVAERMNSDLLFLSVGLPNPHPGWRESFAHLASSSAVQWQEAAARIGLNMFHEVRFGSVDAAVNELVRDNGRIEFILSEPEEGEQVRGHTGLALFTVK